MDIFWKALGGTLIAVLLSLILSKRNPDMAVLLNLSVSSMLLIVGLAFLRPVLDFLHQLGEVGELDREQMGILTKTAAMGAVSYISSMLCQDAGNSALGKGIELAGTCAVLWISLPLLSGLLELIQDVLGFF